MRFTRRSSATAQIESIKLKLPNSGARYNLLTQREREVLGLVVSGLLNKQIASKLGTSEFTVKIQRRGVMQKMRVGSLAELVRMTEKLGILSTKD
jgi:FixJ family two-component response regulator